MTRLPLIGYNIGRRQGDWKDPFSFPLLINKMIPMSEKILTENASSLFPTIPLLPFLLHFPISPSTTTIRTNRKYACSGKATNYIFVNILFNTA